jgi:hypothetical protein
MTFPTLIPGTAKRHALIEQNVIADLGCFADHDSHAMVDEKSLADLRSRMNLNASQHPRDLGHDASQQAKSAAMEFVSHAMQENRMESRIAQDNFKPTLGRRIFTENCIDLFFDLTKHRVTSGCLQDKARFQEPATVLSV